MHACVSRSFRAGAAALISLLAGAACAPAGEDAGGTAAAMSQVERATATDAAAFVQRLAEGDLGALDRVEDAFVVPSSSPAVGSWWAFTLAPGAGNATASEVVLFADDAAGEILFVDARRGAEAVVVPDGEDEEDLRTTLARDLAAFTGAEGTAGSSTTVASLRPLCCGGLVAREATTLLKATIRYLGQRSQALVELVVERRTAPATTQGSKSAALQLAGRARKPGAAANALRARGRARAPEPTGLGASLTAEARAQIVDHTPGAVFFRTSNELVESRATRALVVDSDTALPAHVRLPEGVTEVAFLTWEGRATKLVANGYAEGPTRFSSTALVNVANPEGKVPFASTARFMGQEEASIAASSAASASGTGARTPAIQESSLFAIAEHTSVQLWEKAFEIVNHVYCAAPSRSFYLDALLQEGLFKRPPMIVHLGSDAEKVLLSDMITRLAHKSALAVSAAERVAIEAKRDDMLARIVVEPGFLP